MVEAFQKGEDIPLLPQQSFRGCPRWSEQGTTLQCQDGEFWIVYSSALSKPTNQPQPQRGQGIDWCLLPHLPKLKAYMNEQVDFAREKGYVETVLGRRRYLKDINSQNAVVRGAERNAVNAPIQGSAADIIKLAMINIHCRLKKSTGKVKCSCKYTMNRFWCPESRSRAIDRHGQRRNGYTTLDVPLVVDVGIGQNWLEAH